MYDLKKYNNRAE